MLRIKHILVLIAFLIWNTSSVFSQVDCSITLKEAQKQFDDGVIEKVPTMLASCLKSGFSKEEKLQALKLLTLTYLFEDKQQDAEESMMKLLKIDPEYEVNTAVDPIEFINLHGSFRTEPIYTFGLSGGLNFTTFSGASNIESFGVGIVDETDLVGNYSQNGSGFQVTGSFSRHIMEGLSANLELSYMNRKFQYSDALFDFSTVLALESQSWFAIPVSISYGFLRKSKLQPMVTVGYVPSFLLSAKSNLTRTYTDNSLPSVTGPEVDVSELRDKSSSWLSASIGAKYKINKGYFTLNIQYLRGLNNQTNPENRYSHATLMYKYWYTDSDFYLDNIAVSVGYSYSLYSPKLKTKIKDD